MRLGLVGTMRRRWGGGASKSSNPCNAGTSGWYLALAVAGHTGRVRWAWQYPMKANDLVLTLASIGAVGPLDAVVWDGAPVLPRIFVPAYRLGLNPPERVFEEVRRH